MVEDGQPKNLRFFLHVDNSSSPTGEAHRESKLANPHDARTLFSVPSND